LNENGTALENAYGIGSLKNVNIVANRVSNFTIPLQMIWHSTGESILADPVINVLQSTIFTTPRKPEKIAYEVEAKLPIISWTGWKLKKQGQYTYKIDDMTKEQRNMIMQAVRQFLAGFFVQ
jgi:hypothetical protein